MQSPICYRRDRERSNNVPALYLDSIERMIKVIMHIIFPCIVSNVFAYYSQFIGQY